MSSKARVAVSAVLFIGFLFGAVFPTRTYLAQQRAIAAASERLTLFESQNDALAAEAEKLRSQAEIERLARARYNLVRPGEEAYAVVPTPPEAPMFPGPPAADGLPEPEPFHPALAWAREALERFF